MPYRELTITISQVVPAPSPYDAHPTVAVSGNGHGVQLGLEDVLMIEHAALGTFWLTRYKPLSPDETKRLLAKARPKRKKDEEERA